MRDELELMFDEAGDFFMVRGYTSGELLTEYGSSYESVFEQMMRDAVVRTPIFVEDVRVERMDDLLMYVRRQPYLFSNCMVLFLFLSQTIMALPVGMIVELLRRHDPELVVCEPEVGRYYTVHVDAFSALVRKNMRACRMDEPQPRTVFEFWIDVEVDFIVDETVVYIHGRYVAG